MRKRALFIINPISGTGGKQSIPKEIEENIDRELYDYEIAFTEHAGHAAELTTTAADRGVDVVVAVGGDGTVNEVARSLVHTSSALGIIPCGSGNGLARHLQIPKSPKKAIEIINQDLVHCLDYGLINDRPFFCTCGMGYDAFVSQKFAESGKRGVTQYIKEAITAGIGYKPQTYVIEHENGTETLDAFLIACANASQYGNNAFIAPTASMKDGLMDVVIMTPFAKVFGPQVALQMFTKTLKSSTHIKTFKTKKIHITRECEGPIHFDGDPVMMGREIDVKLVEKSFNVVVNPEAHAPKKNYLQEFGERLEDLFNEVVKGGKE